MKRFADPAVAAVFKAYPAELRRRLMELRALVFEVAAGTEGVGRLTETLKWGQPSYLTEETTRSTSIARAAWPTFRELYPNTFRYESKRAILFDTDAQLPLPELRHCIGLALTHHLRAK